MSDKYPTWLGPNFHSQYFAINIFTLSVLALFGITISVLIILNKPEIIQYHQDIKMYKIKRKQEESSDEAGARSYAPIKMEHNPKLSLLLALFMFWIYNTFNFALGTIHEMYYELFIGSITNHNADAGFVVFTIVCFILQFVLYGYFWSHFSQKYDREYYFVFQLVFGIIWGVSQTQIMVTFYRIWRSIDGLHWFFVWLLSWICLSIFMPIQDQLFWSVYVAPSHENKWSMKWKPILIHIPNSIITLAYLVKYDTVTLFVMIMSVSLVCCSCGMRMPPPTVLKQLENSDKNTGNTQNIDGA